MRKIESYDQIRTFTGRIRSLRKGFVTNFYWDDNKHQYWIDEDKFLFEEHKNCILLLHNNQSFSNLFFIATDYDAVVSALQTINLDCTQVIDIVCKGDGISERNAFKSIGFKDYRSLYRMSHIGQMASDTILDSSVCYGRVEECNIINEVFQRDFDPICEQLPSLNEIEDFAKHNQILVIKDGESLCGFLIFEITGITWYLRYWYTSPRYRNKGIGAKLIKSALVLGKETKRQLFWVISDNENAIKRYEHYGFRREDMNDYVIIKRK